MTLACTPTAEVVSPQDLKVTRHGAVAIVVVYSRTGHTARAGKALAEQLGADYLRLQGQAGAGDSYFSTPAGDEEVWIEPRTVDLSRYRLVLLGTPIWFWEPTAHINTFVASNGFAGKHVVLFYTFEGGVDFDEIGAWKRRLAARGGRVIDTFGIDRSNLRPHETAAERAASIARARGAHWHAVAARGR